MSVRGGQGPRDPVASPPPARRANPYQRTGRYGRGPGDQRRYERYGDQRSGLGGIVRFLLFLFVLAAVVLVVMGTVARPLVRAVVVPWAWDNPAALQISLISDLVREDLGSALTAPASADDSTVEFVVEPGDTPTTLAPKLEEAGVIDSQRAFLFEARQDNLLSKLNAGRYSLALNLTPAGVVDGLVNNLIKTRDDPGDLPRGPPARADRRPSSQTIPGTEVDPKTFYNLVKNPPDALLGDYPWLLDESVRPKGASLEGFLYPATYTIRVGDEKPTTAEDLVREMLDAFHDRVGPERLAVPAKRGLSFYEILTLASIVEREAVLDDGAAARSPASTRTGSTRSRASPTGSCRRTRRSSTPSTRRTSASTARTGRTTGSGRCPRTAAQGPGPARTASPGTTPYKVQGLPPGPIATPTIASIDAALHPDTKSKYTYFVAIPNGNGAHDFSKSARRARAEAGQVRLLGCRARPTRGCRSPPTSPLPPTPAAHRRWAEADAAHRPARVAAPPRAHGRRRRRCLLRRHARAHALAHRVHAGRGRGQGLGAFRPVPRRRRGGDGRHGLPLHDPGPAGGDRRRDRRDRVRPARCVAAAARVRGRAAGRGRVGGGLARPVGTPGDGGARCRARPGRGLGRGHARRQGTGRGRTDRGVVRRRRPRAGDAAARDPPRRDRARPGAASRVADPHRWRRGARVRRRLPRGPRGRAAPRQPG